MNPKPIADEDLSAYADGQLAAARVPAVEAALAHDSELAAQIAEIRSTNAALTQAFDPWLGEPIPTRLLAAARRTRRASRFVWTKPAAALAASLIVGIAVGWFARQAMIERDGTPTTFVRQVALTHALYAADARRPVEVWAAEEQSLVRWLTRRLGFQVHAPNLNEVGFALVGGRLVAGNVKPTALFMYENAAKERLTLQVRKLAPKTEETAFRYAVEDGVGVFYWVDENCGYAISGKLDRAQLLPIARMVYGQIAAAEAAPK